MTRSPLASAGELVVRVHVEFIFNWKDIGYVALRLIANRDASAFTASALVLVTLFALLSLQEVEATQGT